MGAQSTARVWSWASSSVRSVARKRVILVALVIAVLFIATRLYDLTLFPLAGSEATPITWALQAQRALDRSDWFAAVRAAAQPLHSWLLAPAISFASNCADQACHPDRVLAARLLSVGSGAATLALVFVLTTRLFGRAAACAAALVYVCAPLTLLHDRLAQPSALLTAVSLLALWSILAWCGQPDARRTVVLGIALGMALLTSLQALALLFVVPGVVALWRPASLRRWWALANAFLLAGLLFSVVFTDPSAGAVAAPLPAPPAAAEVATDSTTNAWSLAVAARTYLTWPFIVLLGGVLVVAGAAGLGRVLATEFTEMRWWWAAYTKQSGEGGRVARSNAVSTWRGLGICLLWSAGAAVGVLSSEPAPTAADLVFVLVPAFPLVGWGLARLTAASQRLPERVPALAGRVTAGIVLGVCVAPAVVWDWSLLTDPTSVAWHVDPQSGSDLARYVEGRQSGYGLREIVERLRASAERRPVVVFTEDTAGMPRDGVRVLLGDVPSLELATLPPGVSVTGHLAQRVGRAYQAASTGARLFYLLDDDHSGAGDREFRRANPGARAVQRVVKPGNASHRLVLYELPWQPPGDDRWLDPAPRFGERIALAGYALPATTYRAGEAVRFTLFWEALATPAHNYTVFTHIVADDPAQKIGQRDQLPVAGKHPTSTWRRGDLFTDSYAVPIDPGARPGSYRVIVGLYRFETLERLPITVGGDGVPAGSGDFYELAEIVVTAP